MDPFQMPDNLDALSDEELANLKAQIVDRAKELRSQATGLDPKDVSPELLAEINSVAAGYAQVDEKIVGREQAAQARAAELEAGLAGLPAEEAEPEPQPEAEAQPEPEAEKVPATAAATAAAAPTPTPAASQVLTPREIEPAGELVPAPGAALANARPDALAPKLPAEPKRRDGFMRATAYALGGIDPGANLDDPLAVATALAETVNNMRRSAVPPGVREFVPIASSTWKRELTITADEYENHDGLYRAARESIPALVASGACCTPLSPIYDFCRLAEPTSPTEDFLPVVGAPRGGIRYIVAPDWREALSGVGQECCGDNDDPDNPVLKPCVHVQCPTVDEATVCAISQCVEFGNLTYRTFPELVDNFLADLAVAFALRKEVFYLDAIHAASTAVTGITTGYGATRQFLYNIVLAAAGYRSRNKMDRSATINVMIPAWVRDLIRVDLAMDSSQGLDHLAETDAAINGILSRNNIVPAWYVESATGAGMAFDATQGAGALNEWPDNALVYLFSPGTFVRMDSGSLDLGIVRDSTLNRRNDLQMFMEEWTGVVQLCPESVRLTVPLCPNGAAPSLVTPYDCTP